MKDGKFEGERKVSRKAEKKGEEEITIPVSSCCHYSDIAGTTPELRRIYSVIH
jgi:hypothetical protein